MQTPMQTLMRATPVVMAALLILALSGCHSAPTQGGESVDPDGVACEESAGAAAVWIDVEYSGASVSPSSDECEVDPGTQVTWRAPAAFQLRFHGASPGGAREPAEVASMESGGQQKIRIIANNVSGTYEYDIMSHGVVVDPAIIIR